MDVQYAEAVVPVEIGDEVVLRDGSRDTCDRLRFVQELGPRRDGAGIVKGTAWFLVHLAGKDVWVHYDEVMERYWTRDGKRRGGVIDRKAGT